MFFRFFGSHTRRHDAFGTLLDSWQDDELMELPEIQATLPAAGKQAGDIIAVRLKATVTAVGTLQLEAVAVDNNDAKGQAETWQIELNVRD